MLCITLTAGEYFTIGEKTVVQLDRLTGERVHLNITAPREVQIMRGAVLERSGGKRPDCVMEKSERYVRQLPWNHAKKQALIELRAILDEMGNSDEAEKIGEKLDLIFPEQKKDTQHFTSVSPG